MKGRVIIIPIYVDGGVKDGYMYIGIISASNLLPIKFSKKLELGSIHTGEEEALYYCLDILKNLDIKDTITIFSDQSSLVSISNSKVIKPKSTKTFPKIEEIKNFIESNKIVLNWIKGSENLAHNLITKAYKGVFYNEVQPSISKTSIKIAPDKEVDSNKLIKILQKELAKKDTLVKDLMKIITKLNNSPINV